MALPLVPAAARHIDDVVDVVHHSDDLMLPRNAQRFNPDQDALIQLAKDGKRNGVTTDQVSILEGWAKEYEVPFRGPEVHPNRPIGQYPHLHIGPINHILVNP